MHKMYRKCFIILLFSNTFFKEPFKIQELSVIDPYSLQRFYREIEEENRYGEKIPSHIKEFKNKYRKLYEYIYDKYKEGIVLKIENEKKIELLEKLDENNQEKSKRKGSSIEIKRKNPKNFKFFLVFLRNNGNIGYYSFLKFLRKDFENNDILTLETLRQKYKVFFDPESQFFLHLDAETIGKFLQITNIAHDGAKKDLCINLFIFKTIISIILQLKVTLFMKIDKEIMKKIILKNYFGYFLEAYGM